LLEIFRRGINRIQFINGGNDAAADNEVYAIAGQHAGATAANETFNQVPSPQIITFDQLMIRLSLHTSTGGTDTTYNFRNNGVNTVLVVSIPQGMIGIFRNITDSVILALDDLISMNIEFGSLTTAITLRGRTCRGSYA